MFSVLNVVDIVFRLIDFLGTSKSSSWLMLLEPTGEKAADDIDKSLPDHESEVSGGVPMCIGLETASSLETAANGTEKSRSLHSPWFSGVWTPM